MNSCESRRSDNFVYTLLALLYDRRMFFAIGFSVMSVMLASSLKDDGNYKNITDLGNPKCDRVYNVNTSNGWFDVQVIQPDGRVLT